MNIRTKFNNISRKYDKLVWKDMGLNFLYNQNLSWLRSGKHLHHKLV